jgi:hypothetical protein
MNAAYLSFVLTTSLVDVRPEPADSIVQEAQGELGDDERDDLLSRRQQNVLRTTGIVLLGGAATVFATSLAFKGISTRSDLPIARDIERGESPCEHVEFCYAGVFVNPMTGLGFTAAAALGGGGMHLLGRLRADYDLEDGIRWKGVRTTLGVGIGLLVGGGVALGVTQAAAAGVSSALRTFQVRESGWYVFGMMVPAGALAVGYAHGYARHMRRTGVAAHLRVTPTFGATHGISITGRF